MKIAVSRSVRLQFLRVSRFERAFVRGKYGRLVKGLVLENPHFSMKQNNVQWILFPEYM